jgi:sulfur carrier protein ThiS
VKAAGIRMNLRVKVATILLKKAVPPLSASEFDISVPEGTDIKSLIELLGIPADLVGSVTVDKKRRDRDFELSEGDRVGMVPSISGG